MIHYCDTNNYAYHSSVSHLFYWTLNSRRPLLLLLILIPPSLPRHFLLQIAIAIKECDPGGRSTRSFGHRSSRHAYEVDDIWSWSNVSPALESPVFSTLHGSTRYPSSRSSKGPSKGEASICLIAPQLPDSTLNVIVDVEVDSQVDSRRIRTELFLLWKGNPPWEHNGAYTSTTLVSPTGRLRGSVVVKLILMGHQGRFST
jgi:hypothetical protein